MAARKDTPPRGHSAGRDRPVPGQEGFGLSAGERRDVKDKQPPRVQVLHETIRREGDAELARSAAALAWSALAAGLSMGFSALIPALLRAALPEAPWRGLVSGLGYPVGFLIVILARQQLFTENTLTAVLPVMSDPGWRRLGQLLRLWGIVLAGNLAGVAVFAWAMGRMPVLDAATHRELLAMGRELMANSGGQMFTKGIIAGWLIATMVWMVPAAANARALVILLLTWLIAIGGFTHIIVGSAEVSYLVFHGGLPLWVAVRDFSLPVLAGNVVGGSVMFALISHAQVRSDDS
jgi:formate/nitrite transporter FocA (FNT family)